MCIFGSTCNDCFEASCSDDQSNRSQKCFELPIMWPWVGDTNLTKSSTPMRFTLVFVRPCCNQFNQFDLLLCKFVWVRFVNFLFLCSSCLPNENNSWISDSRLLVYNQAVFGNTLQLWQVPFKTYTNLKLTSHKRHVNEWFSWNKRIFWNICWSWKTWIWNEYAQINALADSLPDSKHNSCDGCAHKRRCFERD